MRTTINIKEDIIKQVNELTGAKNKSQAVNQVLEAFVREQQTQKLLVLKGKPHLEDNWKSCVRWNRKWVQRSALNQNS